MRQLVLMLLLILHCSCSQGVDLEQLATPIAQLKSLAQDPVITQSLLKYRQQSLDLKELLELDQQWSSHPQLADDLLDPQDQRLFKEKLSINPPLFVELILMGDQGQTLGGVPITSDYWQGDEAKFKQTVMRENVYVGEIDWDESSRTISAQISVPVWIDGNLEGVLTGAIEADLEALSKTQVDNY